MKANNLLSLIHQAQAIGKAVPYLNHGGCGVFAANVIKMLDSHGYTTRVWFVNLYSNTYSKSDIKGLVERNLKTLAEWSSAGVKCNHALIEVVNDKGESIVFDSEHMFELKKGQAVRSRKFLIQRRKMTAGYVTIPKDEFLEMVQSPIGWNSAFDRETYKENIETAIQKLAK